jgi:branched-subunit amino acid ABC-type transport system permease component
MAIGLVQTFAAGSPLSPWAPVLPYLALVGMLLLRPSGLLGRR